MEAVLILIFLTLWLMAYVMYSLCVDAEVIDSAFVSLCLAVFGVFCKEE